MRVARPEEFAVIGRLCEEAYVGGGVIPPDHTYVPQLREVAGRARDAELLVAVDPDDEVLGTVTVAAYGSPAAEVARAGELEFRVLATAPAGRGRGVGELLIGAVVERARELGLSRVVISVADDNATAIRLYQRLGFERLPERDWLPVPDVQLLGYFLAV
ncbi:MAG: GNAT family N-acetyltransferase [Thermocrispum sp.]